MRIIGNEKGLNIGFLLGKWTLLATSAAELLAGGPQSYSSRTYLQQQQQHKLQKQHAAWSTNKQICGLSCALLGTRWNQHPHFFVVLSSATKQNN